MHGFISLPLGYVYALLCLAPVLGVVAPLLCLHAPRQLLLSIVVALVYGFGSMLIALGYESSHSGSAGGYELGPWLFLGLLISLYGFVLIGPLWLITRAIAPTKRREK
jgi:hypothetical protein